MNSRHHTGFGILGTCIRIISILILILANKHLGGMKYNFYWHVAVPVAVSQLLAALYAFNYAKHRRYGKTLNMFAKQFCVISLLVTLIVFLDRDMQIFAVTQCIYALLYTALIWYISSYVFENVQKRGKINITKSFLILSIPVFLLAPVVYYFGQKEWMQLCFSLGYCFLFISLSTLFSLVKYRRKSGKKKS